MPIDLTNQADRLKLLQAIDSSENKARKYESLRQTEVYNDRLLQHVVERLERRMSKESVLETPIVSSLNLARRIVQQEASIYKNPPTRTFSDLTDDQIKVVDRIYRDMAFNSKMHLSNQSFKLQNQNHIMIVPKKGKLIMRVLRNHHLDSIDNDDDPEMPDGFMLSQIDKNEVRRNRNSSRGGTGTRGQYDSWTDSETDRQDQPIGDNDDFKKLMKKHVIWTDDLNFIMDGKGNVISETDQNLAGLNPIIDISLEKDYEYWVRQGDTLIEFTLEYCALMSDISQVVRMQGYAQAYLIAKDDLIPENVQIGPNYLLKLPVEDGSNVRPEFGFANSGADLAGSISFAENYLAQFLSSRGVDSNLVSGQAQAQGATSGVERMLKMIEKFEASRSDYDTYKMAEMKLYRIIKAWHNASLDNDTLAPEYKTAKLPDSSELMVEFAGPEMVKSEQDKIDSWVKRIEAGEASVVDMTMDLRGVDKDTALEIIEENKKHEFGGLDGDSGTEPASN